MELVRYIAAFLILQAMCMASEPVQKAIVIKNLKGEHMGFMLSSLKATEKAGEFRGECVFMLLPKDAGLIETELGIIISELKVAGENPCRMQVGKDKSELWVGAKNLPPVTLVMDSSGKGFMSTTEEGISSNVGIVEFTTK